jgi:hypothetical protein
MIDNGKDDMGNMIEINKGVRKGCPLSSTLFKIHIDNIVRQWQSNLTKHCRKNQNFMDTVLFANDPAVITKTGDDLQRSLHKLNLICKEYNLKISTVKAKVMAFKGSEHLRAKIMINCKVIEQTKEFNCLV